MDAFAALADPTRRRILTTLASGPLSAGTLSATESISRPAVSRHLRMLREGGLVRATTVGRQRIYEVRPVGLTPVRELLEQLPHTTPPIAPERLDALDLEVRRTARKRRDTHREETA